MKLRLPKTRKPKETPVKISPAPPPVVEPAKVETDMGRAGSPNPPSGAPGTARPTVQTHRRRTPRPLGTFHHAGPLLIFLSAFQHFSISVLAQPVVPPPQMTTFTRSINATSTTSAEFRASLGLNTTNLTSITNYNGDGQSITNLNAGQVQGAFPNAYTNAETRRGDFRGGLTVIGGSLANTNFTGGGANLTNLNTTNLTGTLPDAVFPAVLPAVDGSQLTGITGGGSGGATNGIQQLNGSGTNTTFVQSLIHGAASQPFILASSNGSTNIFGSFTPGTTTAGIQEALDSLNRGTEFGPTAAGGTLTFSAGEFQFADKLVYSNLYTAQVELRGAGMLATRLVYTGTESGIQCVTFRGGGNTNADTLDLPLHVVLSDLTLTATNNTTNVLLAITNYSHAIVQRCNFTGWQFTTNQVWGSAVSILGDGATYPPPNLVGLVIGNGTTAASSSEHGTWIQDSYFAALATGMHLMCDHAYIRSPKFAFIENTGQWPTNSPYHLGACILRRPGLTSHYEWPHFYASTAGLCVLNTNVFGDADLQFLDGPENENCDHPIAAVRTNQVTFLYNGLDTGGEFNQQFQINTTNYSFTAASLLLSAAAFHGHANATTLFDQGIIPLVRTPSALGHTNPVFYFNGAAARSTWFAPSASGGMSSFFIEQSDNDFLWGVGQVGEGTNTIASFGPQSVSDGVKFWWDVRASNNIISLNGQFTGNGAGLTNIPPAGVATSGLIVTQAWSGTLLLFSNSLSAPFEWAAWNTNTHLMTFGTNGVTLRYFNLTNGVYSFTNGSAWGTNGDSAAYSQSGRFGNNLSVANTASVGALSSGGFISGTTVTASGNISGSGASNHITSVLNIAGQLQLRTNTAPANVTVGVTPVDYWYLAYNTNGTVIYIPGYIAH